MSRSGRVSSFQRRIPQPHLHSLTSDLGPAFDSVPSWLNDLRKHADPNVAIMRECGVDANSRTGHLNLSSVFRGDFSRGQQDRPMR
jgi:hypothetical protein